MLEHFRFWCNKVLPAVYDDSLSYYEVLTKVVAKLNEVIDSENELTSNMEEFSSAVTADINAFKAQVLADNTQFRSEIEAQLDAFEADINAAIANLTSSVNSALASQDAEIASLANSLTQLRDYVDDSVDGLASETYVNNAVNGLASETYVNNAVSGLASETYVNNAVSGATGVTIATGTFTPNVPIEFGSLTIKQIGEYVFISGFIQMDGVTFADLPSSGIIGTVSGVSLPAAGSYIPVMTGSNADTRTFGIMFAFEYNNTVTLTINPAAGTDYTFMVNGFYFAAQ